MLQRLVDLPRLLQLWALQHHGESHHFAPSMLALGWKFEIHNIPSIETYCSPSQVLPSPLLRRSAIFWSTWLESSWTRRQSSRLRFYNFIFSRKSWQTFSTLPLFQEILEKHFLRFHVLFSKIQPPIPPSPRSRRAWTRWWCLSGTWRNSRPASRCVRHDWQ